MYKLPMFNPSTKLVHKADYHHAFECQNAEQILLNSQHLLQTTLLLVDDAVITTNPLGQINYLNPSAEKLTGWRLEDAQSLPLNTVFQVINQMTLELIENPVDVVLREHKVIHSIHDEALVSDQGDPIRIKHSAAPIFQGEEVIGVVIIFRDITTTQKLANKLSWQLNHDALTGLMNRSCFKQHLEQALSTAKNLDQQHILCYLDLDRFKIFNEVYGHVAGDELLRQLSLIFQKRIRKTDVLARLGGDEFGLILHHCHLEQAYHVLEKLCEEVRRFRFPWENNNFHFTMSIGITLINADSETTSSVLVEADSACYLAKKKGRDRIQVYQANDSDVVIHRGTSQGFLRVIKALEEDRFVLFCQPIKPINAHSKPNKTTNLKKYNEVLLRLQDDSGHIVSPKDFIPAAEQYGLMPLIDRWVIRNLFKQLSESSQEIAEICSEKSTDYCYSINLSGSSLNDDSFLSFVQEQLLLYSISPENICFEITETVAVSNLNVAVHFINHLRKIGCRFALDDFGSGMSSFGYLKSFPVDYIKIDGNFVKEVTNSQIAYEIVKSINSIGHAMNIETTAEFVENEEILAVLKEIGINYVQGYGIAKPCRLSFRQLNELP